MYEKLMAAGRLVMHDIYFDVGSAVIRPESVGALGAISTMLTQHPGIELRIEVHTDNAGAAERNHMLSAARAAALVDHLIRTGVEARRLMAEGCGSMRPVAPNDTPANRQRNRRIELVLLPTAGTRAQPMESTP